MRDKLKVYIVQTNDCWPLPSLLAQLNNCQEIFQFVLVDQNENGQYLKIRPHVPLREVTRLSPSDGRRKVLQSYLTERDWSEQTRNFLETCTDVAFKQNEDLAVAIGAGVYVLDDDGVTFKGLRDQDAFSCIYDYRFSENDTANEAHPISQGPTSLDAFAAISVLRYEGVFHCRYQDHTDANRANRARYLVTNLTHFLAARAFWTTLAREHSGQSCVMETNWGGGDYLAGYYTSGLCEACIELLHSKPCGPVLSYRLRDFSEHDVVKALNTLCALPAKWTRQVGISNFLKKRLLPVFFGVIGLGLLTNLMAGYSNPPKSSQVQELLKYMQQHSIAAVGALVSIALTLITLFVLKILSLDLP